MILSSGDRHRRGHLRDRCRLHEGAKVTDDDAPCKRLRTTVVKGKCHGSEGRDSALTVKQMVEREREIETNSPVHTLPHTHVGQGKGKDLGETEQAPNAHHAVEVFAIVADGGMSGLGAVVAFGFGVGICMYDGLARVLHFNLLLARVPHFGRGLVRQTEPGTKIAKSTG